MSLLLSTWGLLTTVPNRLLSQWALVLAAILGLVSSISLILSIPLYADSIYYQTLQTNIADPDDDGGIPRPPFTYMFHYYGGVHGPVHWEDVQEKPVLLKRVEPYYPEAARKQKISGMVLVDVVIDTSGSIDKAEIYKSIKVLDQAALDAAMQFKFSPGKYLDRPVKVKMRIPFKFQLK